MAIKKLTFDNGDLNGSNQLVWNHLLNTEDVIPCLSDQNGVQVVTSDIFSYGDDTGADKPNYVTLDMSGFAPLTGTWKILLYYVSATEGGSGRRAFEQTTIASPDDDMRVIIGKAATPSLNMTFTQLFAHLLTKLGFLKTASNLSDLVNTTTARSNLGVYSTAQVDAALAIKASLYQAGSGAVLGVSNTAAFTPSSNYHPATKYYVDSRVLFIGKVTAAGAVTKLGGSLSSVTGAYGTGEYTLTHNIGNADGYILLPIRDEVTGTPSAPKVEHKANTAEVNWTNFVGSNVQVDFRFIIYTV